MTAVKHEDAVMKMGFDYFRDTILKMLNIHYQFVDSRPTELIEIDIENLYRKSVYGLQFPDNRELYHTHRISDD